jgi:hypothetical protein
VYVLVQTTLQLAQLFNIKPERDRKQWNIFESKVYISILDPVKEKEKENWRILTNKEIYARVKNPTVTETIRLDQVRLG